MHEFPFSPPPLHAGIVSLVTSCQGGSKGWSQPIHRAKGSSSQKVSFGTCSWGWVELPFTRQKPLEPERRKMAKCLRKYTEKSGPRYKQPHSLLPPSPNLRDQVMHDTHDRFFHMRNTLPAATGLTSDSLNMNIDVSLQKDSEQDSSVMMVHGGCSWSVRSVSVVLCGM